MRRPFLRLRNALARPVKGMLDRRYAGRLSLVGIDARLGAVEEALERLGGVDVDLRKVQVDMEKLQARLEAFLGSEGPWELRRWLIDSQRLAGECARAIELLSQQRILLRRDLDEVAGRHRPRS